MATTRDVPNGQKEALGRKGLNGGTTVAAVEME